jgi:hypothetical protein
MFLVAHLIILLTISPATSARTIHATNPCFPDCDTVSFTAPNPDGFEVSPADEFWCPVPRRFAGRILQFAVVQYRKDQASGSAWITLRARIQSTGESISWEDQFGSRKYAPPAPANRPKQSSFLGFPDLLGHRPITGIFVGNATDKDQVPAMLRLHRVDLVFLHSGPRVPSDRVTHFSHCDRPNSLTRRFRLDSVRGVPLSPGQSFEFHLPANEAHPWLAYLVLKHRKEPSLLSPDAGPQGTSWDQNPAYILVEVLDAGSGLWRRWADRYGAAKYSEPREAHNPEDETLHNGLRTFGRIQAGRIRITNIGRGDPARSEARIHELQAVFYPDRTGTTSLERIFTPETVFNNPENNRPIPLLGGGPRLSGRFPDAIPLGPGYRNRTAAIAELPASHSFPVTLEPPAPCRRDGLGRLIIPLPEHGRLVMAEFALGDLDVVSLEPNKDGFFGRSGRAELTVWLRNRSRPGRFFPLLIRNNIGMAGLVTTGAPVNAETLESGDELVISVSFDVAFLMGYRITLAPLSDSPKF